MKDMATHSNILAWHIPWTEEPGGLQSIGLQSQTRLKQLSTAGTGVWVQGQYPMVVLSKRGKELVGISGAEQ